MQIRVDDHMFQKDGKRKTHLMIYLQKGEVINDALVNMICPGEYIHFHCCGQPGFDNMLRIECSSDAMGRLNPRSLWLGGCIEKIEDGLFERCTLLEDLWLGGSLSPIMNEECMNLKRMGLRHIGCNGYGMVQQGEGLRELVKHIHENGGEVEMMYE